jgi:hypothetical protein
VVGRKSARARQQWGKQVRTEKVISDYEKHQKPIFVIKRAHKSCFLEKILNENIISF